MAFSAARWRRSLDQFVADKGDTITLRRLSVDAEGAQTVSAEHTCPAAVFPVAPQDLAESGVRDIRVVLSGTSLGSFGVPARDDRVLIDGDAANVMEIETIKRGGEIVRVNLLCRG